MADTYITYTGNGSTTNYSFTFPYLEETDVKVSLDGTVQPTSEYSFANATTIQFNTAPANAVVIKIYRSTSKTSPPATFFAGSAIRAQDLNENFLQQLYIAQETSEATIDAVAGDIPDGTITADKLASNLAIDLTSGTAGSPSLTFDANTGIYSPGEDQIALTTAGVGRLFISDDGKVGIGVADPSSYSITADDLVIASPGGGNTGIQINITDNLGFSSIWFGSSDGEGRGQITYGHSASDTMSFTVSGSAKAQITSTGTFNIVGAGSIGSTQAVSFNGSAPVDSLIVDSLGNVGIGTGSPGAALDVVGNITASGDITATGVVNIGVTTLVTPSRIQIGDFSLTGASDGFRINGVGVIQNSVDTTTDTLHFQFYNPNGAVGSIKTNGSATSFNENSDYRLKENVVPLTGAADRLNQLQVYRFNFIADPDKTFDGFLAHEAQAIVPESVTGTKDEVDENGDPVYQGIDKSKLVPLLTAALQEALAKIGTLENKVAVLEAQ